MEPGDEAIGAHGQAKETPPASDSPSLSSQLSTGLDRDRDTTGTTSSHVCVCTCTCGDTMSVEMIATIKAKRLAKIRATIKTDEDLGHGNVSE